MSYVLDRFEHMARQTPLTKLLGLEETHLQQWAKALSDVWSCTSTRANQLRAASQNARLAVGR